MSCRTWIIDVILIFMTMACCLWIWSYPSVVLRTMPTSPIESVPGPVEPQPRIEDHTAAVMAQLDDRCLSWNRLRDEYGITITCDTMTKSLPVVPLNYGGNREYMPCGKIVQIQVADHIAVEGGKKAK